VRGRQTSATCRRVFFDIKFGSGILGLGFRVWPLGAGLRMVVPGRPGGPAGPPHHVGSKPVKSTFATLRRDKPGQGACVRPPLGNGAKIRPIKVHQGSSRLIKVNQGKMKKAKGWPAGKSYLVQTPVGVAVSCFGAGAGVGRSRCGRPPVISNQFQSLLKKLWNASARASMAG
jgi:hypothetical protein